MKRKTAWKAKQKIYLRFKRSCFTKINRKKIKVKIKIIFKEKTIFLKEKIIESFK